MSRLVNSFLLICFCLLFVCSTSPADDWPAWRGPTGDGVAVDGEYPTEWSKEKNLKWKVELPGLGSSTPIVKDDRIFVTSGAGENRLTCLSLDGKQLWSKSVGKEDPGKHKKASGANSSPVTDGKYVFAYFKSGDLAGFDLQGNQLWQVNLQEKFGEDTLWWDLGTSPFLTSNHVVVACVQTGPSYIVAFDKMTGDVAWKVDRQLDAPEEAAQTYSTPIVATRDGREMIYVLGADHVTAHTAEDGKEVWRVGGLNPSDNHYCRSIASAVLVRDMLVAPYDRGTSITGIRLGGKGDVTESHVAYTLRLNKKESSVDVPTPAADGGTAIVCSDKKVVFAINAKTGEKVWEVKVGNPRTTFSASPVVAGDHVYVISEDGTTFVIDKKKKEVIAENSIDEFVVATPVPVNGNILIRSDRNLYCFGK